MRAVFLGEGTTAQNGSLVVGTEVRTNVPHKFWSLEQGSGRAATVQAWLEIWDYVGSASFRGFIAERGEEKSMFVFFQESSVVEDLKPGYV